MKTFDAEFSPASAQNPEAYGVYPDSIHKTQKGSVVYMAREETSDILVAPDNSEFVGVRFTNPAGENCVKAPLTHENASVLRKLFPFTAPKPVLGEPRTFGLGDRLGIATPGHIRAIRRYDAFPVFAQQSIRELSLTGRTYENALDCATFAVFRENFTRGFGADGDHLKTIDEVKYALSCGYTMITLDCSEHIRNDVGKMIDAEVNEAYSPKKGWDEKYSDKSVLLEGDLKLTFDAAGFRRMSLIYGDAIEFAREIYETLIRGTGVDFEISIDETETPTTPAQHYFVANELRAAGVLFATMAPRFCGEFQKGIDYIGDLGQFRREFDEHATIAKHFGYKISIHSGSDKFKVFPIVGELAGGRFHVKTSGTNWLEAMRLVAMKDPALYREVHHFALTAFTEARRYYHVTTNLGNIPNVDKMPDGELPSLFEQSDSRQIIHITYGTILNEKADDGSYVFRDRLYRLWRDNNDAYFDLLDSHIGRHLEALYRGFGPALGS
jgi:hypothetical protein